MFVVSASLSLARRVVLSLAVLAATAGLGFAQGLTTAAMNGFVESNTGEILIGATVVAKHLPTNTVYGTTTRTDGRFNLNNLRPGGPYAIKVSYIGFRTEEQTGIYVELSQNLQLSIRMVSEDLTTEEVVVTAERNPLISSSRMGAGTSVSTEQLASLPTISRSIQDFTRLTPQVNGNSVGGKNNRYNNIQVDGAVLNDVFGLAENGTPGGQAGTQPISLDVIQEFKVNVSPFDIRQGGFTGGLINAITKSGSNNFHGTGYWFTRNEGFVTDGPLEEPYPDFSENTRGLTISGPIIEDKLFFLFNFETAAKKTPNTIYLSTGGEENTFNTNPSGIDSLLGVLKSKYGYDAGAYSTFYRETESIKFFARLDYNISDEHTLTIRHNFVDGSDDNLTRNTGAFSLSNRNYVFNSVQNSTVLQLNSLFSTSLSNEFRVSYTAVRDNREIAGKPFPSVTIGPSGNQISFGPENFSGANGLDQDLIEITNNLTYYWQNHAITVGTNNEIFNFDNLFIRDYYGNYNFASLSDFYAEKANRYQFSYATDRSGKKYVGFGAARLGFYAQDEIQVLDNLNVTAGLRVDVPMILDEPTENPLVKDAFGYNTTDVPSGNLQISPRVGFNWDVFSDKFLQIRGGTGIFSGRTPFVWLSNNFSNTGKEFTRIATSSRLTATVKFIADPNNQYYVGDTSNYNGTKFAFSESTSEINIVDPDYVFPQVWRTNLAADVQLPYGFVGTMEMIYSTNMNDAAYYDINYAKTGSSTPDGRPTYAQVSNKFTNVMLLKNTEDGYQFSLTPQIQKPLFQGEGFWSNLAFNFAYTYGKSEDLNSVLSSQANSQVARNPITDPNNLELASSNFEIKHRFVSSVTYLARWSDFSEMFSGFNTTISLFWENRSGYPYSLTYSNDYNGDSFSNNDLIYIPKDENDINLVVSSGSNFVRADAATYKAFFSYINSDKNLKDQKGKIMKRNSATFPWVQTLDLRMAQEIPVSLVPGHKFEITFDILNFFDLISDDLGLVKRLEFANSSNPQLAHPLQYRGIQSATAAANDFPGQPIFSYNNKQVYNAFSTDDERSRAYFQLGIRYTF